MFLFSHLAIITDKIYQPDNDKGRDKEDISIESHHKVNILLQGYISNAYIEDFALVSDSAYAAQV